jgi:PAS domain S-box-containing protein
MPNIPTATDRNLPQATEDDLKTLTKNTVSYRDIISTAMDGFWLVDTQGNLLDVNNSYCRMSGYNLQELQTMAIADLEVDETEADIASRISTIMEQGEGRFESRHRRKDGSIFDVEISVQYIHGNGGQCVAFLRDITGVKLAEDKLRNLSRAIEQSPVTIVITDPHGVIEFVNHKFVQLTGYTAEEAIGKNPRILKSGKTPPDVYANLWKTIVSGKTWEGEVVNKSKDGSLFWEYSAITPLRNEKGTVTHYLAVKEDITEKKHMLEQLISAKEQADLANQAKSSFLATMSHEIRTPMNGVIGMTGLLLETSLTDEQREFADIVRKSGESLLSLINDILDFSKIEAGRLDLEFLDFDLRVTLEDTAELLAARAADAGLELIIRIDPAVPSYLKGDPGRLRQIVSNLVSNAIKFTNKGEIVISAALQSQKDNTVTIHFGILDTGIGIPESRLAAIFEPFTQVDGTTTRKYGGTGLGLAICKQLAELMGGEIGVMSEEGKGSTFWFTVVFEKPSEQTSKNLDSPAHANISGTRILIVDDNATNQMLLTTLLNNWGCHYETATDGETGFALLLAAAQNNTPFKIALLDHEMPGMDGQELGRRIKGTPQLASVLLVMVTSLGQRGDASTLERIGFAGYLVKPIRQSQLRECLELVLGRADQTSETQGIITRHIVAEKAKNGVRILLAEDNVINQKVAQHMLKNLGYRVDVVANGWEAVRALEMINYDLVLMDCMMPDMDGFEATAMIRDFNSKVNNHDVPIIAMTANAMKGDREKCIKAGMDDYLSKPVKLDELNTVIERWISCNARKDAPQEEAMNNSNALPLFDEATLLERLDNDREFTRIILEESLRELPVLLEELRKRLQSDDALAIRHQAHTLKGMAANISAEALRDICSHIETVTKDGNDVESARKLLPKLEKTIALTIEAIGRS